jgi:hypothetical protein
VYKAFQCRRFVIILALLSVACLNSPAHALENEFHGLYSLTYFLGNYESAGAPGMILTGPNATLNAGPAGLPTGNRTKNLKTNNYFEQRARLYYNAKANDSLKLVTAFEIDMIWGDRAGGGFRQATPAAGADLYTGAFRNSGGALEGDAVNLETKWVYLDLKIPKTPTRAKVGLQPFKDNIKGIFADFDAAGINTVTELGDTKVNVAYFRAYDQSFFSSSQSGIRGHNDLDIAMVGAKHALSDKSNIGLDYYLYNDPRGLNVPAASADMRIHTVGLYGETNVGKASVSGFLAYQNGDFKSAAGENSDLNAVAYNLAAKAPVAGGTLKTALLFTSGNSDAASRGQSRRYTGWVGVNTSANATWNVGTGGGNTYNDSDMMLLNRAPSNMPSTTDNHLIFNSGNGTLPTNSQGQYLYSLGYELPVSSALLLKSNVGLAWAARTNVLRPTNKLTGEQNSSNFQGSEINIQANYKVYDNLTAKFQAAYVMLGDYYNNSWSSAVTGSGVSDPQDPYSVRLLMQYIF